MQATPRRDTVQAPDILIVEDDPSDLELTLHVFDKHRLTNRIEVARDGAEALDVLFMAGQGGFRPKLLLLDLKLPKVSGVEVLRKVKATPETRTLPVVVLTSSREDRDISECYRLGVNSYVVKPVDFGQFTEAVRQLGLYWLLLNQPPCAGKQEGP